MLGSEIITKFNNMIDDTVDTDFAYQLMNDAKDEVEATQTWEVLNALHTFSVSSGSEYTTTYNLPSDFAYPLYLYDSGYLEYPLTPFKDQRERRDQPYGYFLNGVSTLQILGTRGSSDTFYLFYQKYSADIEENTSWSNFPDRWHKILPLKMAELYYAADAGEKGRAWDDRWANQYERILQRMKQWNSKLKVKGSSNRGSSYNPKAITSYA